MIKKLLISAAVFMAASTASASTIHVFTEYDIEEASDVCVISNITNPSSDTRIMHLVNLKHVTNIQRVIGPKGAEISAITFENVAGQKYMGVMKTEHLRKLLTAWIGCINK